MTYIIGIDGGGSTIRAALLDANLTLYSQFVGETVNPSLIGREESAKRIQEAIHDVISQANLESEQIAAVGLGIAGAAKVHSESWLRQVVAEVLPRAKVAASSDYEIALVGAHGERQGALILAGTGSLAYGVNKAGESWLAGGWGYLLGDEGSGYWLGAQALRAAARMADGRGRETELMLIMMNALNLEKPLDLVPWLYQNSPPRARDVAQLAPLVLESARSGDAVATDIVSKGAYELALAARAVLRQLHLSTHKIAFAGSLLTEANPLSALLCELLGLKAIPKPRYAPVIGAAILAHDHFRAI
jgi:N-acetylglucosamine kinase-like BadF-type ATPase